MRGMASHSWASWSSPEVQPAKPAAKALISATADRWGFKVRTYWQTGERWGQGRQVGRCIVVFPVLVGLQCVVLGMGWHQADKAGQRHLKRSWCRPYSRIRPKSRGMPMV